MTDARDTAQAAPAAADFEDFDAFEATLPPDTKPQVAPAPADLPDLEEPPEVRIDPADLHADEPIGRDAPVPDDPELVRVWDELTEPDLELEVVGVTLNWPASMRDSRIRPEDFTRRHLGVLWALAMRHAPADDDSPVSHALVLPAYQRECAPGVMPAGQTHLEVMLGAIRRGVTSANAVALIRRLRTLSAERGLRLAAWRVARATSPTDRAVASLAYRQAEERLTDAQRGPAAMAPRVIDVAECVGLDRPPLPEPIIERLLPRRSVCVLFGAPSSGKTWSLANACADLIMGGGCFVGDDRLQIRPYSTRYGGDPDVVLWIYGSEDTAEDIVGRMLDAVASGPHAGKEIPRGRLHVVTPPHELTLDTSEGMEWVLRTADQVRATVVVLDTVASLCDLDVSDNGEVRTFMRRAHRLRDSGDEGRVVVLVHHTRKAGTDPRASLGGSKADSMMGSQAWRALSDQVILVDAVDGRTDGEVTVRSFKSKRLGPDVLRATRVTMPAGQSRFRALEEGEDASTLEGDAKAHEEALRSRGGGRPRRDYVAELAEAVEARGRLPVDEAPAVLSVSVSRWRKVRDEVIRGLAHAGFPVVSGVFVTVTRSEDHE